MKRGKRYREALGKIDRQAGLQIEEAVTKLKELPSTNFDETVEVSMKLGVDVRQSDQQLRGAYSLPKGIGKSLRVIVFAQGEKADEAREAGAIEVGDEDLVKKIEDGWMDFDVAIASPDMMRFVGKLGRTLGPKGLMPSPKSGTVTNDVAQAVSEFAAGKVEYRTDNTGNVHVPVGKKSFEAGDLVQNISAFIDHIKASKPTGAKGRFIEKAVVSTTMSPGLRLETGS